MRSQSEILKKLEQIEKSGVDPTKLQRRTLIHKLYWEHAVKYLPEKQQTAEWKEKWKQWSSLDKAGIAKELDEQIDYTYMLIADKDKRGMVGSLQVIMIYVWLMGPGKDRFLKLLIPEILNSHQDCGRSAMRKLCEEYGYRWDLYEMRYLKEGSALMIADDKTFNEVKRSFPHRDNGGSSLRH